MPQNPHARFLLTILYAALAIGAAVLLLVPLAPFLIAAALAALLERPVAMLAKHVGGRRHAALLCTLLLAALLLFGLYLLVRRGCYELGLLLEDFPLMLGRLPSFRQTAEQYAYRFLVALPVPMQDVLRTAIQDILTRGVTVPASLYEWLVGTAGRFAAAVPGVILFSFTALLAVYFLSSRRPELRAALARAIPPHRRALVADVKGRLTKAVGGWLRVQGILLVICFFLLTAGFLVLGVEAAFLIAACVSLLDALPVFGVGTVLIPWAAGSFFAGDYSLGFGLFLLYAILWVARSILEPKLMGEQVGLPPLAALLAMYAGFHFFGLAGMILAPLAAAAVWPLLRVWMTGGSGSPEQKRE